MAAVKFIARGCSAATGNFAPGDTYRGDPAVCRHLVEEACCAEWIEAPAVAASAPAAPEQTAPAAAKPGRKKKA